MDSVVHFEIPVENTERAKKFYSSVFGWSLQQMGPELGNYIIARTAEMDEKTMMPKTPGTINGGIMKRNDKVKAPVIYMYVKSVDKALKEIEKKGGKVVQDKTLISGKMYMAYFNDPEGNLMGIVEGMM